MMWWPIVLESSTRSTFLFYPGLRTLIPLNYDYRSEMTEKKHNEKFQNLLLFKTYARKHKYRILMRQIVSHLFSQLSNFIYGEGNYHKSLSYSHVILSILIVRICIDPGCFCDYWFVSAGFWGIAKYISITVRAMLISIKS